MRIGVFLAILALSAALCAALFWGGTAAVALMMHGLIAHPWVAKAMAVLPMLVLPLMAVMTAHRHRNAVDAG